VRNIWVPRSLIAYKAREGNVKVTSNGKIRCSEWEPFTRARKRRKHIVGEVEKGMKGERRGYLVGSLEQ